MRLAKLSSASGTDQLPVTPLAPHPYTQRLGGFINFVPVDSVARPSQYFCEFVVAHSAESSRTAPSTENPSFIGPLRIPAQSRKMNSSCLGRLLKADSATPKFFDKTSVGRCIIESLSKTVSVSEKFPSSNTRRNSVPSGSRP